MPTLSPKRRTLRARKAALVRHGHPADDVDTEIRTESLAEHIRNVIDQAPPLTPEQRDKLAGLLRPGQPLDAA